MALSVVEDLRTQAILRLKRMKVFAACWPIWQNEIVARTDNYSDAKAIFDLGGQLRDIFFQTSSGERGQGDVSGGGAAWEGFVCWYLNLVLTGTRAVVIKQSKSLLPRCISDAMAVNYKNRATNTESDLSGIIFPSDSFLINESYNKKLLEEFVQKNFHSISLHNIQCKTNWNDNAQIPMLWDMIYQFRGVKNKNVSIGRDGFSLSDFKAFSYSFVTMPSQKAEIKSGSMPVQRVESLSGGNYWGKPSQAGVALSISEMFRRVFDEAFDGHVHGHISAMIEKGMIGPKWAE